LIGRGGEPGVAVEVDLDGEREPGLQADVEEAELAVEEVEVEEEALAPGGADHRPSMPIGEPEAAARLDRGEHADQTRGDAVAAGGWARPAPPSAPGGASQAGAPPPPPPRPLPCP